MDALFDAGGLSATISDHFCQYLFIIAGNSKLSRYPHDSRSTRRLGRQAGKLPTRGELGVRIDPHTRLLFAIGSYRDDGAYAPASRAGGGDVWDASTIRSAVRRSDTTSSSSYLSYLCIVLHQRSLPSLGVHDPGSCTARRLKIGEWLWAWHRDAMYGRDRLVE